MAGAAAADDDDFLLSLYIWRTRMECLRGHRGFRRLRSGDETDYRFPDSQAERKYSNTSENADVRQDEPPRDYRIASGPIKIVDDFGTINTGLYWAKGRPVTSERPH
ncbi:hypothetical protein FKM82_029471 [Ascaphus truei]